METLLIINHYYYYFFLVLNTVPCESTYIHQQPTKQTYNSYTIHPMHSTIDPPLEHLIGQMITTTVNLFSQRYREEKSLRHVAMIPKFLDFNKPWSYQYGRKKTENNDMYDFPVQDCTQEQNGSQCSTMQMAVSVKKDC